MTVILGNINFLFAGDKLSSPLKFSDPRVVQELPKSWHKKGIIYDKWVDKSDVAITLDQHLYPALMPFIKQYEKENGVKIAVKEGACGISGGMLFRKQVDIAGFCCPLGKMDRLPGATFHTLGIAALSILVHSKNPVDNLGVDEIKKIFRGVETNWSSFSKVKKNKIHPIIRTHCKKRPGHWHLILPDANDFTQNAQDVAAINDMISIISDDEQSIGYEVYWNAIRYKGTVKAVSVNGISPLNREEVSKGNYPYYRVYSISIWDDKKLKNPVAADLVSYLTHIIEKLDSTLGIVPSSLLKKKGWKFYNGELIGEPDKKK